MDKPNVTTYEQAMCLSILKSAAEPIVAAWLAARLHLSGCRETQRRHVRAIIKQLRDSGSMIVATLAGGYWLTEDRRLWADYLDGRQIDAKRVLGVAGKRKKTLRARRQGFLFNVSIPTGCTMIGRT